MTGPECEHLECRGQVCPHCGLLVDAYGNAEDEFRYCTFPDCGCDGARLCMAEEGPNGASYALNLEKRRR